jgi:hypothetical protein
MRFDASRADNTRPVPNGSKIQRTDLDSTTPETLPKPRRNLRPNPIDAEGNSTFPEPILARNASRNSWGWYVMERDGFRKPNRFGYARDGYGLCLTP